MKIRKTRKITGAMIALALIASAAFTACEDTGTGAGGSSEPTNTTEAANGSEPQSSSTSPVTPADKIEHEYDDLHALLTAIAEEANKSLEGFDQIQPFLPPLPDAPAFDAEFIVGVEQSQFDKLAVDAVREMAAMMTTPFEMVLIETNDAADAKQLAYLIAENYDPGKWICVFPATAATMQAGNFVLVAAADEIQSDAIAGAFEAILGANATVNLFHEGDLDFGDGDGGFGFGGGMGEIDMGEDGIDGGDGGIIELV